MADVIRDKARIISIDGPIAIGKTTLGRKLRKRIGEDAIFFPETGHKAPAGGENPVDVWLEHPTDLAAAFQMSMYCQCQTRMMLAERDLTICKLRKRTPLIMIDRSLVGNAVFAVTNHRIGNISDEEFRFYRAHLRCEPIMSLSSNDVNIQLWAPVETCARRLGVRDLDDTTTEEENYQIDYFFELARTTFCALLSNLSREQPQHQLVINWEAEPEANFANFCAIYNSYVQSEHQRAPVSVVLSHAVCPSAEEQHYDSIFDFSALSTVDAFFSRHVIYEMMNALGLRETYTGPRRFYVQLPVCVQQDSLSSIFPLTIK
jgi:deoxyadenosine/deoxycytidine kinase